MSGAKIDVSGKAYDINGMLRTCILACDPMSTIEAWNGDNGIERTLEVAERMMSELVEDIERLETRLSKHEPKQP
jgi:hypothetical protein